MNFRKLDIEDKNIIEKYRNYIYDNYEASDLNFVNLYAWRLCDEIEISKNEDFIVIKGKAGNETYFLPPLVKNKEMLEKTFALIKQYCDKNKIIPIIRGVTDDILALFNNVNIDSFHFITYRNTDVDEYVYSSNDLITLSGKKFNAKRNHVKHFTSNYQYVLKSYESSDYERIVECLLSWGREKTLDYEIEAITSVLKNYEFLNVFCNMLEVDNKIIAFTIGTICNENIGIELFEKANIDYDGAYAAINQLTAERYFSNIKFINRQEDMGIPGLRKAKLSYHPHHMINKYSLVAKEVIDDLKELYIDSFSEDLINPSYVKYFFDKRINFNQTMFIEKDRKIISALYLLNRKFNFNDKTLESILISTASTLTAYRHQGYFHKLMIDTLKELENRMLPFVILYPTDYNIYYRYGFTVMNYFKELEVGNTELMYKKVDYNDIEILSKIYNQYTKKFDNYLVRDEVYWREYIEDAFTYGSNIELIYKNDIEIGYVTTSIEIDELVLLEEVYLSKYSKFKQLIPSKEQGINGSMIRIIDLEKLLYSYSYPQINEEIKIKVIDKLVLSNNRIFDIVIDEEGVDIKESDSFDLEMNIEELTEIIFTGKTNNEKLKRIFTNFYTLNLDKC